jgi:hypothetical protein
MGSAGALVGQAQGIGAQGMSQRYFDPFNAYASDVYNTNTNAQASMGIAAGNRQAGLVSGGMNMFGNLFGGAMQGGLFNKQPTTY